MTKEIKIKINVRNTLLIYYKLFAISLPFELLFEIYFEIDTIFKPTRILALIIIAIFLLGLARSKLKVSKLPKVDLLLVGMFVYGIFISLVRILSGPFRMGFFYNNLFQVGLLAAVYFIYKSIFIKISEAKSIFRYFIAGVTLNALYIYYLTFFAGRLGRMSGFTDNPNYFSLGLAASIIYLVHKLNFKSPFLEKISNLFFIAFLLYPFSISGSRTGLVALFLGIVFVFVFSKSYYRILILTTIVIGTSFIFAKGIKKGNDKGSILIINRLQKIQEEEDVRFAIWRGVLRVIEEEGYWGLGIGQYQNVFPEYYRYEVNRKIIEVVNRGYHLTTHNDYLGVLVDYGFPALAFYIVFLLGHFYNILLRIKNTLLSQNRFIPQLCLILLSFVIIFGLTSTNFQHHLFWFLLMFSTNEYTE